MTDNAFIDRLREASESAGTAADGLENTNLNHEHIRERGDDPAAAEQSKTAKIRILTASATFFNNIADEMGKDTDFNAAKAAAAVQLEDDTKILSSALHSEAEAMARNDNYKTTWLDVAGAVLNRQAETANAVAQNENTGVAVYDAADHHAHPGTDLRPDDTHRDGSPSAAIVRS